MTISKQLPAVLIYLPVVIILVCMFYAYGLMTRVTLDSEVALPKIQGLVLKIPKPLTNIQLANHQGQAINSEYFIGKWHVIAYGYTHCPDICPTTLFTLTQLADLLSANQDMPETEFIFYTVDPFRDSQAILGQYIQYFSKDFVAMRANSLEHAQHFQQSLGIKVEITSRYFQAEQEYSLYREPVLSSDNRYQVNHGLTILLINPEAELQAVFLPQITAQGLKDFSSEALYGDYLQVIKYYQQGNRL